MQEDMLPNTSFVDKSHVVTVSGMDDIIETIQSILPQISKTQLQLIQSRLTEIGVETVDNLRYITSSDLSDIVKIVPARKLITCIQKKFEDTGTTDNLSGNLSSTSAESSLDQSGSSTSFTEDTTESPNGTWAQTFVIPWERFPKIFLEDCEKKKRPDESMRREAIRILCHSIREVCKKPTGRDIYLITAKFVNKYMDSLGDKIMGKIIGNGCTSVIRNITERLNNCNRKSNQTNSSSSSESSQRYGCLSTSWNVDVGEEEEQALQKKVEWMKQEYITSKNMTCKKTIDEYMNDTYPLQRKLINNSRVDEVRNSFPYLFEREYISIHFNKLTGHALENYKKSEKKKFSILHFLRKEKAVAVKNEISIMDNYVKETNHHFKLMAFIKILMAFFKEDGLIEYFEPCTDKKCVEAAKRENGAPVIAVIGDIYSPLMHHIILEGKIVSTVNTIDDAVMILFALYYIFNLEYHPRAAQTLEFVQRVIIGINPETGSKKPKKSTKKGGVSSKVVALASHLDVDLV